MSSRRNRRRRWGLLMLFAAGFLFQNASCALDTTTLLPNLLSSIASVLISSWVDDQLGIGGTTNI